MSGLLDEFNQQYDMLEINVDGDGTGACPFYERHGYLNSEPGEDQPLLHYYRELGKATS